MTVTQAKDCDECSECRKAGVTSKARRTFAWSDGRRLHMCLNHALPIIHGQNLYDFACNPTGKK